MDNGQHDDETRGTEELDDPWATSDGKEDDPYSIHRIYAKGGGRSDTGEQIKAKISLSMHRFIQEVVAAQYFPEYKTMSDYVRDAIVHKNKYVADRIDDGNLRRTVNSEIRKQRTEALVAQMNATKEFVAAVEIAMRDAARDGDHEILDGLLTEVGEAMQVEREPYRGKLRKLWGEYCPVVKRLKMEDEARRE